MTTVTTRQTTATGAINKGAPLSNSELDQNFIDLNLNKLENEELITPQLKPTLLLDFLNSEILDSRISFARNSVATRFNKLGALETVSANQPRFNYDPITKRLLGLLIEEQRINSLANNTMVGAAAGTPGTLPTTWAQNATGASLSYSILGTGTEFGVSYIDIRFFGTPTISSTNLIFFALNNAIAATNGQTWTGSSYVALIAGSLTNIPNLYLTTRYNNSSAVALTANSLSLTSTITSSLTRFISTLTATDANTAFVNNMIGANFTIGQPVDLTLRIGMPQLEQGSTVTTIIPTSSGAVTRLADTAVVTGTNFSSWYNQTSGTLFSESQQAVVQTILGYPRVVQIDDGSNNNLITTVWRTDINRLYGSITTSGVEEGNVGTTGIVQTNVNKLAVAYATNDFAGSINGAAVSTDTAGTVPSGLNTLRIGGQSGAGANLNGHIRSIRYYPTRLSNAELQAITTY